MMHVQYGRAERQALRHHMEQILPTLGFHDASIARIRRKSSRLSTSYDTATVTVQLNHGDTFKVFLKNYDACLRIKNDMRERRDREVRVYEELLSNIDLNTAAHYGTVWDDEKGWHWLLLEFVEGSPVGYCKEMEYWIAAAGWLGRFHGYFSSRCSRLKACDWLIHHDTDFLGETADLALRAVTDVTPHLRTTFKQILDPYPAFVEAMVSSPFTLVHGAYRPQNVMVSLEEEPMRLFAYDWEEAAVGSPYYDLAHLVDGFEPPLLDRFFDRYADGASPFDMPVPPRDQIAHFVNCFRLHMIVNSLSRVVLKGYSEDVVAKLVRAADERYGQARRSAQHAA